MAGNGLYKQLAEVVMFMSRPKPAVVWGFGYDCWVCVGTVFFGISL